MIVGVDEVGRGCWAGPMCVGAVAFDDALTIDGLKDSKLLSAKQRKNITMRIKQQASAIGLGWVSATEIDRLGLTAALTLATTRALGQIVVDYDQLILDGATLFSDDPRAIALPKADSLVPAVSAAAVVAKVARDTYMQLLGPQFAKYHFVKHVGYGTLLHRQMLELYGPSAIHRRSFRPIKDMLT